MEYTSMGSRGKYSSENNLWSRQWSASQPSSRRGSEQSGKDGSTVPRTGTTEDNNKGPGDVERIGASIDALRREGELSMGAPPPLSAAFSGSVSNFTHQGTSGGGHTSRRASRRSIAEQGSGSDRTADINGDEGRGLSSAAARSVGNLSQGSMLGASLGSRSALHKQKSGDVQRSMLSSINDVSSSAEELDSGAPVVVGAGRKASASKANLDSENASSLPPKFTLRQESGELKNRSSTVAPPPRLTSQQDVSANNDDGLANSKSNLQVSQQDFGEGGKVKGPYASRSTLPKLTNEAARSRNELKPPPGLSSTQNVSSSVNVAPVTGESLQAPQQQQHQVKKAKSPYASRASFKASTDVHPSDAESRKEGPPQGSSTNVNESTNKASSASQSALNGGKPRSAVRGSRASVNKSANAVHGTELRVEEPEVTGAVAQSSTDDSSAYVGYVPSYAVRAEDKAAVDLGVSKSMNLGPRDFERSAASVAVPSKSAFDLRAKGASSTHLSKNERKVRIEEAPGTSGSGQQVGSVLGLKDGARTVSTSGTLASKSAAEMRESDSNVAASATSRESREVEPASTRDVKTTSSPKQVQTSFASLTPEKHDKASGASTSQLTGSLKTFTPKQVQTSFASVVASTPYKPSVDARTKQTTPTHEKASGASHNQLAAKDRETTTVHEKAGGASYNQLAANDREARGEETTRTSGAGKSQSSADLKGQRYDDGTGGASVTKASQPEPVQAVAPAALPYSAAPSSFVTAVLSSIKARNKAAEQLNEKDAAKQPAGDPVASEKSGQKAAAVASNVSLGSRATVSGLETKSVPLSTRQSENEIHRFSSSATTSAARLNDGRSDADDNFVKNSRVSIPSATESSLYSSRNSMASRNDRDGGTNDVESRRLGGKVVSIGGLSSVGNSVNSIAAATRGTLRTDGTEYSVRASERGGSTNSLRKRYGGELGSEGSMAASAANKEDAASVVEPSFERSYAFALKWDPYTLRVKCEHKGEIRLAYLPIRKILDEHDDSCMIVDTFQKLFSDSIHNPDVFDPSRHFLAFLDADGDWCTLGDTPEDYKVFVESSKFDPTKAASRVARLKSFDLSILEDLSRPETGQDHDDDFSFVGASRRQSHGSVKSATSVGERSGGRKLMHGDSEVLKELFRKDSFGTSFLSDESDIASREFEFTKEAFSFQQAIFMGWLVGAAPMAVAVRHSEFWMTSGLQTEEYHREEPWYDYTVAALGFSMLLSFVGFVRSRTVDKQRLGLALVCVNAISFCSYLSIVAGLTPAVSDIVHRPLEIVRYLDWAFTCPTLVLLMGQLTQTEGNIRRAMIANVVMITSRFFGSCLPWTYALPFSAASFGCFSFLISDMWHWWSAAVARKKAAVNAPGKSEGSIGVESLNLLRVLSTASSVMYPVIWLLGISDVVSFEESEVLYCVADVLAKVVFTMIAVRICFAYQRTPQTTKAESDKTVAKKSSGDNKKSTSSLFSVSQNLQREPSVEMENYESATVIVCDVVGLKEMTARHTPTSMLKTIKNLSKNFETIARVHHVYKVESKGEAFMGVAGAPDRSRNHAEKAAEFALDVLQMIKVFTSEPNKNGQREKIRLRIGLHTGPLSAGIIDRKTLRYGVFGETVSKAIRMERTCVQQGIQLSEDSYQALVEGKDEGYEFEESEKGESYFLVGKRHMDVD